MLQFHEKNEFHDFWQESWQETEWTKILRTDSVPLPKIDFPYHEISGPDICSLICVLSKSEMMFGYFYIIIMPWGLNIQGWQGSLDDLELGLTGILGVTGILGWLESWVDWDLGLTGILGRRDLGLTGILGWLAQAQ